MANKPLIAVVTGANKGIGQAIVTKLATDFAQSHLARVSGASSILIYLTARDEARGKNALQEVQASTPSNASVRFAQLDVTIGQSVRRLADELRAEHGTIDVLVNNAGVAVSGPAFSADIVKTTMACNYDGTREMCKAFLPLLNTSHGRLVNMSSMLSSLAPITNPALAARLRGAASISAVDELMGEFVRGAEDGDLETRGWPRNGYGVSKMGVTALTRVLARENPHTGLLINACCPGWVATDMTRHRGAKTPMQGARLPVHLALGDLGGLSGEFWFEMKPVEW